MPDTDYAAQVYSTGGVGSPLLRFRTTSDTTPPAPVTNLTAKANAQGFVINWTPPTTNADGTPLQDLKDYWVTVHPTGDATAGHSFAVTETTVDFHLGMNRHYFGTPRYDLTFVVQARDLTHNLSTPVSAVAEVPPLEAFTVAAETLPRAIKLTWPDQLNADTYRIYRHTGSPVPIDNAHFVGSLLSTQADSTRTLTFFDIPEDEFDKSDLYYQVEAVGFLGQNPVLSNTVGPIAVTGIGLDETPPTTPGVPTGMLSGGTHNFRVKYDAAANPVGASLYFIDVYASKVAADLTDANVNIENFFVGRLAIRPNEVVEETFVWVATTLDVDGKAAPETVHVALRATNGVGIGGPLSGTSSVQVSPADGQHYIQSASITDAHITNLNASKLVANSAIVNTLNIGATINVAVNGYIQSSNYSSTAGYRLSTDFADFGSGRFRGTLEATGGFISTLNVTGSLTVGSSTATTSGTVSSYNWSGVGGAGWAIYANGSAYFNNVDARGYISATSGLLSGLTISGTLSFGPAGKIDISGITIDTNGIVGKEGTVERFRLSSTGAATFRGTVTSAAISSSTITGSTIETATSGSRIVLQQGFKERMYFYYTDTAYSYIQQGSSGGLWISGSLDLRGATSGGILYCQGINLRSSQTATTYPTNITHTRIEGPLVLSGTGTAGAPGFGFTGNTNSGIYYYNGLSFSINGTKRGGFGLTDFHPNPDNTMALGTGTLRWKQLYAGTTTISTSDMNLKSEVADSDLGLDFIKEIRPIRFKMDEGDSGRPHYGFAAQEVKEVIDRRGIDFAGYVDPSINPESSDDPDEVAQAPLGLRYEEFIAPIVKAIQELSDRLDVLESR